MPDWFYRTVSRPVLFRLPAPVARDFALGFMGTLARLPLGPAVIDFLGHMCPDRRLRRTLLGVTLPSQVGLGPHLDTRAVALPALARFGLGFLEVGPVVAETLAASPGVQRRVADQALWYPDSWFALGADGLARRLAGVALRVPLIVRLGMSPSDDPEVLATGCRKVIGQLAPFAALFTLTIPAPALQGVWGPERWRDFFSAVLQAANDLPTPRLVLLCLPTELSDADVDRLVQPALAAGVRGVLIDGSIPASPGGRLIGAPAFAPALNLVRRLRQRHGTDLVVIAAGGIHEPEDALRMRAAGADLIQIDSGLVYSGPGLSKRINEALLYADHPPGNEVPEEAESRAAERAWCWTALMGAGMLFGAILALLVAATRVVLHYDEGFVGMSRAELAAINNRLLAFMAHDRVSLAGTMIAIGVLYLGLSLGGIRRGLHWARQAVLYSAFVGFASFFLFLGFGYLDPFHAFVTSILFQFLLLALHSRLGPPQLTSPPELREDWRWRWSQWGQLLFIVEGCGLLGAGAVISFMGATTVFVPEDLEFMHTTAETLATANPRLIPLIAHDRATFGGMLVASGVTVLLTGLWGFRRSQSWLWWTLLCAGVPAYAAAIGVHLVVGYTDPMHLAPAFSGAALFGLGLALSYPHLCATAPPIPFDADARAAYPHSQSG